MVQIKMFDHTYNVKDAWLLHKTGMSKGDKPRKLNMWFLQGESGGKTVSQKISAEKAEEYKAKGYKVKRGSGSKSPKKGGKKSGKKSPKKGGKKSGKKSPKKGGKKSGKKSPKKGGKKSPKKSGKKKGGRKAASCSSKYKACLARKSNQ